MNRIAFFLLFFQALLFSAENDPYELVAFGGEPSSIIGGCVSAITGNASFRKQDLVACGKEPIVIERKYFSGRFEEYFSGWEYFFDSLTLKRTWPAGKGGTGKPALLKIPEKQGFHLLYLGSSTYRLFKNYPDSLTNCYAGKISGRFNARNNNVFDNPESKGEIIVEGADGSIRCYHLFESPADQSQEEKLRLISEVLPNRNVIHYKWEKIHHERRLTQITSTSPTGEVYAWVNIRYTISSGNHLDAIHLKSSDGQELAYRFDSHAKQHNTKHALLTDVFSSALPSENISYWNSDTRGYYLSFQALPEGRYMGIDYYTLSDLQELYKKEEPTIPAEQPAPPQPVLSKPTRIKFSDFSTKEQIKSFYNEYIQETTQVLESANLVDQSKVRKQLKKDVRHKRVKNLYGPIGPQGERHSAYEFSYSPGKYKKGPGLTTVLNAHGDATYYYYNKYFLVEKIRYCRGKEEAVFIENFEWHAHNSSMPNWLKSKTICDAQEKPLIAYEYEYDEYGNVATEKMTGNLTGKGNIETYAVSRTFYPNNLLHTESFPNGKQIIYTYLESTDLTAAKYVYDNNALKIRYFYRYDGNVLVEEIVDDGTATNAHDLSGVTERLIKKVTPRRSQPFYGFPSVIEEKFYDINSHQEVLLRKQEIEYDTRGQVNLISHYDCAGRKQYDLTYTYDRKGRLISQTDPLGRRRAIQHDENNNPTDESDPNEAFTLHHRFDLSNRPTQRIRVANSGEQKKDQTYYNLLSQKKEEVDEQGNRIEYEYDPFGHVAKIQYPPVFDERGNSQHPIARKEYNALGAVSREIDPEGNETTYFYTSRAKPHRIVHPNGSEEFFYYTLEGEVEKHLSPEGVETRFTYDYQNRLTSKTILKGKILSEEKSIYNAFHLIEKIDPDGISTYFSYDGAGRKIKEESLGRVTLFSYDHLGRLVKIEKAIDSETAQVILKTYDLLDRVVQESELGGEGNIFSHTRYSYDKFSNNSIIKKEVQFEDASHFFEYDSFRRPTREVNPLGEEITITYNDLYKDKNGQTVTQKTTVDPKGLISVETFNNHGFISTFEKYGREKTLLLRENYYYDFNGNKVKQVSELFSPNKKIVKSWKYNALKQLVELNESGEKITRYSYTPDGHLKEIVKPDGVTIAYEYDGLGRQTSIKTSDGSCHYSLLYDQMGNVIESYDHKKNRKTTRTYNHFGDLLEETLANHFHLKKKYDALSRCIELQLPDDSKVQYLYDPYHLKSVKRIDSCGAERYEHTYDEYDHSHNLIREFHAGSLGPVAHQVDLMGRRIRTEDIYSTEQIAHIDPNGNVLKYIRSFHNEDEVVEYSYDDLDQLISETGRFEHVYTYDSHHNRTQKDGSHYNVDSLHQLHSTADTTYDHDANGNRIAIHKTDYELFYAYDGLDRLTEVRSDSKALNYIYDSWGRCISKIYLLMQDGEWNPLHVENFLYDGQNELGFFPRKVRILGQGRGAEIGATIAIETPDNFYVPFHDLYGNIIAILDGEGHCIESYRFSAYGEEEIFDGTTIVVNSRLNPWRFQSKRKVGGLINFGRRFYDPETGRWLSPDPKGFNEGPNLYQFSRNNPLVYFDLYGEAIQKLHEIEEMESRLTVDLDFEKKYGGAKSRNWNYYPERDYSKVAAHPLITGDKEIGYIGGINNTFGEHRSNVRLLSKYAGGMPIHSTYNATHGIINDIREARMGLNLIATTPAVLSFERKLNFFAKAPENSVYFQVAHSQGMIHEITSQLMMPKEYRDRTVYLGIAPAVYMPNSLCKSAFHYESIRDIVPHLQKAIGLIGNTAQNVSILKPHPEAPLFDHSFSSPTFKLVIVNQVEKYMEGRYDY